jgi:uncharacterized membrane protein YciS (DUF1049 family)
MRTFYLLILLVIVAAIGVFAYQNNEYVTIYYLDRSGTSRMSILLGAVYLLGMLSGWTVIGFIRRTYTRATER